LIKIESALLSYFNWLKKTGSNVLFTAYKQGADELAERNAERRVATQSITVDIIQGATRSCLSGHFKAFAKLRA